MRQLANLRENMERRKVIDRYPLLNFLASLHQMTMPTLEEILQPGTTSKSFDDTTDLVLEKRALELLEKRKLESGR